MSVLEISSGSSDSEDESEHLSSEEEETVEVEGFQVHVSKENQVKEMFKDHPHLFSDFDSKINQHFKNAYMDVLLDVIETLSASTSELSWKDIVKSNCILSDLTREGFKVDWVWKRLNESLLKKEKQRVCGARIKRLEKLIKKQKLKLSDMESDLKREKVIFAAAEA